MTIQGLSLISATPRKSGKISVLMEVEDTDDNIRAFSDLYRKKLVLTTAPKTSAAPKPDSFDLFIDIRTRCQQIQDLITNKLEPLREIEPLQAADEFPVTEEPPVNDFYGEDVE